MSEDLISVQRAIEIIDSLPVRPRIVQKPLAESQGLRLAREIVADRDYPPFDKSLLDGFAVRSADGLELRIVQTIWAGSHDQHELGPTEAAAIMTGAPVPAGADAIAPVEETQRAGDRLILNRAVKTGHGIARRGTDVGRGTIVLSAGAVLDAPQIAVAASVGAVRVSVFDRPNVSLLCTGDELVDVGRQPTGSQIRNSNGPMMSALLRRLRCTVTDLGVAPDDRAQISAAIEQGRKSDVLFVVGGMSRGEHDYVPALLREMGLDLRISKLSMKPGKPFVLAADAERFVIGLPGNPVSAFVCTVRLAAGLLRRIGGGPAEQSIGIGNLTAGTPANGSREFYQPAVRDGLSVTPLQWKGSADIYTLAAANCLIIRPANAPAAGTGTAVEFVDFFA